MKYIKLERLTKLNKNAYTLILIIFYWFLYKIIHNIDFNTLENKTILEINNTKYLFIKPGFVKTGMQIIHNIYYVNI